MQPDLTRTDLSTPPVAASRFAAESAPRACPPGSIPAKLLFQSSQEILIGHNGDTYRLRITKNGKLILTK